jgi:hypothetical protein
MPNLNVDPVGKRLERIVEEKKATNEEALGRIKSIMDSWEKLNKTIETDIKDEFELMDLEKEALDEALGDLEENRTTPVNDAFTITGTVRSEREKIGLPNVTVVLLQPAENRTKPLGKEVTDNSGNFVLRLGESVFGDNQGTLQVEYRVLAGDGTLLHSEVQTLTPRMGGIARVQLAIAETDVVSNQLAAGKAVKDSIVDSRDLIASRVENMRGAHDALAAMTAIARDDLDSLRESLAVSPPELKTGDEPKDPEKEGTKPPRPERPVLGLESIKGIGLERAEILKRANIKDIQTFIRTDNKKLTELLGEVDFAAMKREAKALLKEK